MSGVAPYKMLQWAAAAVYAVSGIYRLSSAAASAVIELAGLCERKGLLVTAVRFYTEAFVAEPQRADDLIAAHRYNAACYAARAARGDGDAADLKPAERSALRGKALTWLRADLALRQKQAESGKPADRATVAAQMTHWLQDADLSGVRHPWALWRLPEAERAAWRQLWADVDALRKKAVAKD